MVFNRNILLKGILFAGLLFSFLLNANAQSPAKKTRILFLMDASSSMTYPWNADYNRFGVASNILLQIVDSIYAINNEIEFAVRAYGTQYPAQEKNCYDTRLEVPFNIQNANQIKNRLKYITPVGFSPIAYSLIQASDNELSNSNVYDYSIIFITDGGESCNGDVCKTFKDYIEKKIKIKPYVIGLDKNEQLKSFYECMGNYIEVTKADDIMKAVKMIVDANRPLLDKPKQLNIKTTYSNTPVIKDTAKKIIPKEPEIVKSKNIFPLLSIVKYPMRVNERSIINASYIIIKKGNPISLKFNFEEEKKEIPKEIIKRENNGMAYVRMINSPQIKKLKNNLTANRYLSNNTEKATIRFALDEPAKPKPARELVTIPNINFVTSSYPVSKLTNVKLKPFKAKKGDAKLRFEIEEERDNVIIPKIRKVEIAFNKVKSAKLKPSKYIAKKADAKLKFEIEEPRQNILLPKVNKVDLAIQKNKPVVLKAKPFIAKKMDAKLKFEIEEPRQNILIPKMNRVDLVINKNKINSLKAKRFVAKKTDAKIRFEIESPKKEILTSLRIEKYPMRYSYAFRLPQLKPMKRTKEVAKLYFTVDAPKKRDTVVSKPETKPIDSKLEYTVETENSDKTMVQVFFKGPDRKAYLKAKPDIEILDPITHKLISTFKRDMNGIDPVPQPISSGRFDIVVKGYNDLITKNVEIQPNKINKVFIKVTDGTLSFAYIGNRNRPVEFTAIVNRRFAAGATILQKCSERLNYDPGTYYVEIQTMPASKFSIDLTFGAVYEIQIPEPGTLQITNTTAYGKVQLQSALGDQFLTFKTLNITGNISDQRLILQPGPYKAIIPVDPNNPLAGTKIVEFRVGSNKETLLELR
jgi:hypothetical protein